MVYSIRETARVVTGIQGQEFSLDLLPRYESSSDFVRIHWHGSEYTDPSSSPIKAQTELGEEKSRERAYRRIDANETVGGTVYGFQGSQILVEFARGGQCIQRSIDKSTLDNMAARDVKVGDRVALISTRSGNTVVSHLQYLGSGLYKLSAEETDRLDKLRKEARKRQR